MGRVVKQTVRKAATGMPRDLLVALRDKIAERIDQDDLYPRDLHALSRQLIDIRHEIEELDAAEAAPKTDEPSVADAVEVPDERWNAS